MKQLLTTIALTIASLLATTTFADPIHTSAATGNLAGVQAELDKGVDVNARDNHKWTPLTHAAQFGHKEIAELLIANGADVNAKDGGGFTPLHQAAQFGRKEVAELLIANGADVNAKDYVVGWTPLHHAAQKGHKEIAELLIAGGADVNAKDKEKDATAPLHLAAKKGHKEIVELLISKGADVNAKGGRGDTPLDGAIEDNHTEIADLLRKHGGKTGEELKALFDAVENEDFEAVKQAIADGIDVNAKNQWGLTPLHFAAFPGQKEIAELLIAKGADVNAKDNSGRTPLDLAIQYNKPETADLLRQHGGKTGAELALMPRLEYGKNQWPFTVSFTTAEGSTYVFQASGDLKNWSKVEEVNGTGGEVKVTDWREAIFQKQYYRVKLVE